MEPNRTNSSPDFGFRRAPQPLQVIIDSNVIYTIQGGREWRAGNSMGHEKCEKLCRASHLYSTTGSKQKRVMRAGMMASRVWCSVGLSSRL
jgi:hypothetical protein